MKASKRIGPQAGEPAQGKPAADARTRASRRAGHGLFDDGCPRQLGGGLRELAGQALGLDPTDSALQAERIAHEDRGLGQGGARTGCLARHAGSFLIEMGGERAHALPRRRTDGKDARSREATLVEDTAQVGLDGGARGGVQRVDVSQGDRHGGVRGTQARQPLVVQSRVCVLLGIDHDDQRVHARGQPLGYLGVSLLD